MDSDLLLSKSHLKNTCHRGKRSAISNWVRVNRDTGMNPV
jgi:hypothetical protein